MDELTKNSENISVEREGSIFERPRGQCQLLLLWGNELKKAIH